jgi:signal transduction histidine kinase
MVEQVSGGQEVRRNRGSNVKHRPDEQPEGAEGASGVRQRQPASRWWRSGAVSDPHDHAGADHEHRQLLADVGHELRTPLSIMLALCGRLEDAGRLDGQDAEDVARIRANAYTMLRRVQDLMLVSRLESADLQMEAAVVDVAGIVRSCVEGFGSVAGQRGLDLRLVVPDRLPAVADEEKLVSVVSNLVANAIRHAPAGGVVRCSLAEGPRTIVLEVADNGPGVPPDQRGAIFERYHRGTRSGGIGLGLAIVGEIATLHGGSVSVGDAPEGGALFTVEMPRRSAGAGASRTANRSLMLVDRQKAIVEDLRAELESATG